jgi:predicted PhzF superfamily epimerase YddE/YHI9
MLAPLYVVDAFAVEAMTGNPAAVVLLRSSSPAPHSSGRELAFPWRQHCPVPDDVLAGVADEMNLSETAFVQVRPTHAPDMSI